MGKRFLLILTCLIMSASMSFAQQRVTGQVLDADSGEPVIGASVVIKGTGTGAPTDVNGRFTINNVPNDAKSLMVSYIGMKTKEVTINKSGNMRIFLQPELRNIDEVMVVAYGTATKQSFTGSAAVVGSDDIGKVQVTNPIDALKGKASGIQINNVSGQPGSTPTIRIRGINSINAGNAPLIVVDGSPYDGSLNDINPVDVESITVLKDAASTALYGARGGNGVVLITTKKAKKGDEAVITVDAKWGSNQRATPDYKMITSPEKYYEMWYKGLYNYALDKRGMDANGAWDWANSVLINDVDYGLGYNIYNIPDGQYMIGQDGKLNPNATMGRIHTFNGTDYLIKPDDWADEVYNNALRQEYTVTATGSSEKGTFYLSANYLDNEGITAASNYKRFTSRLKADYQVKNWLKLEGNMTYGHFDRNYLNTNSDGEGNATSTGNVFAVVNMAPIYPMYIYDANGNKIWDDKSRMELYDYGDRSIIGLYRPWLNQSNPESANRLNTHNTEGHVFNGTGTAEIRLPYGFKFININNFYLHEYRYTDTTNPFFGQYKSSNGIVTKEHVRNWSYNHQQRIEWAQSYGKNNIEAMVAHEYYRMYGYDLWAGKQNQFSPDNKELAGAVIMGSASSTQSDYNDEKWLGRASYNFDEKYFGSVSLTREASSHFHPDNRWGTFWSIGAGWLINKEKFMSKADWIDMLKLKISYGENGNDDIGAYRYTTYYTINNSNDNVSLVPDSYGKKDISWEKNGKFNVGFDFSFWNGRLSGTVEYYSNITKDMLSWFPLAPSFGFTGYFANVGNMRNNGFEFDFHGDIIRNRDLTWSAYYNFTSNNNKITKLPDVRKTLHVDDANLDGYSSGSFFYTEGKSRYTYYTKRYAGPDEETGEATYWKNVYKTDENGDVVYDANNHPVVAGYEKTKTYSEADNYVIGDVLPDVYGGFGTSLEWKGIDFSVDFQYQFGGRVYDSTYAQLMNSNAGYGIHVDMLNAWSVDDKNSNIPRWQFNDTYMASTSDRFLVNASYLSLQNITLGYTFPRSLISNIGIEKLRLYLVADNVWVWSKRQGLDPRQSIVGTASNAYYSSIRTISFGVSLTL